MEEWYVLALCDYVNPLRMELYKSYDTMYREGGSTLTTNMLIIIDCLAEQRTSFAQDIVHSYKLGIG